MIRMSWARAASVEETLALWAASLREIKKRIRPLFNQDRVARNAGLFLESLFGDDQRKTGGPRLHDWCYLELADLEAEQFNSANDGLWTRGLLIRRRIADGDPAFFTTWCPAGTAIETLVAVEGHRWAIEDSFETAKNEFGLDHNESRSWHGWHRHVSLVMLAFAMMATIRHRANPPPKKTKRRTTTKSKMQSRPH